VAARRLAEFPSTVGSAMIKFPASLFLNVHLPYFNHDIAYPFPTFVKAGNEAVRGASILWPDRAT